MPSNSAPSRSSMADHSDRRQVRRRKPQEDACETCGKVYRHPNCLIKHRWEHHPSWREAAQYLLSKHQQVQMMEAAAILIGGDRLPTDRALWPSFMSDGMLLSQKNQLESNPRKYHHSSRNTATPVDPSNAAQSDNDDDQEEDAAEDQQQQQQHSDDDQEEDDAKTDDSFSDHRATRHHPHAATTPIPTPAMDIYPRARSRSRSYQSSHYHPYALSPRVVSHSVRSSHAGWDVIGDSPKGLPVKSVRYSPIGIPIALPIQQSPHAYPSYSPFGSLSQSFGSSSASSYIPSSSIRSSESDIHEAVENDMSTVKLQSNGMIWSPHTVPLKQMSNEYDELEMEMD